MLGKSSTEQAGDAKLFEPGKLIAVVGSEHVLAGDLVHYVEPAFEQNKHRLSSPSQEGMLREQILRSVLRNYVETKALYLEFFRDAAGAVLPDKLDESKKMVTQRARELFFEKQVPDMMEKYEVNDMRALETKLREKSMSLATMQRQFVEQVLGIGNRAQVHSKGI